MKINIRVPASSANLGSGVDCLGLALALYLDVEIEPWHTDEMIFERGFDKPLDDGSNLILTGMRAVRDITGMALPPLKVRVNTDIPLSHGLGSSASAIVAGVFGANALLGSPLTKDEAFNVASRIETHPDNIAPAVYGGFTVAMQTDEDSFSALKYPSPDLHAVLAIPATSLSTKAARSILPKQVALGDAVHQLQHAALLTAALSQSRYDLLRLATEDLLFTPARKSLIPAFDELRRSAIESGALCVMISGAGPSVMALAGERCDDVRVAMLDAYSRTGIEGRVILLDPDDAGTVISRSDG